jgi:uncharacterized protein (DUF927 family)
MSEHHLNGANGAFAPLIGAAHPMPLALTKEPEVWEPRPAPASLPNRRKMFHPAMGEAKTFWTYRDADGAPLFLVARFEAEGGKKETIPFTYGRRVWDGSDGKRQERLGWHMKAPAAPRPLYGLDRLAAHPDAPVLVVEGEKTADAAGKLFSDYAAVTSQGGSKAAGKSTWSPLAGRHVFIWPDRDDAGLAYANEVARRARAEKAKSVQIVQVPQDWPQGWDLADPLPTGVSPELLQELLQEAPDADPPMLPPNFKFRDDGLWYDPPDPVDGESTASPTFIAAPFEVVGEANDGSGTSWGLVIRWLDGDNRRHQWSVPKRLVHADGNRIAEELEDSGLHCNPLGKARTLMKTFIGGVRSKRRLTCVDRTGWHSAQGKPVFILPGGEAYGPASSTVILQTEHASTDGAFLAQGSLAEWQQHLGRYAVGNHRMALCISTALATPLLDIVGGESGGIHLVGDSKTGKSTMLFVAGSIWGKGARGAQVRQWRATANGLESAASETSDTVLILDEMGQASGSDVADTIYMLANGSGKLRAGKEGGARRSKTWRTMFLSTGEISLGAKMAEAGKKMMAGLEVRLLNLPADAGVMHDGATMGVVQNRHGLPSSAQLVKQLEQASKTYYGTAGRAFLSNLVRARTRDPKKLEARLKNAQLEFAKRHVPAEAAGQVRNVADRLALTGAAGELGIEWGVLPWPKGEAMAAAVAMFKLWLEDRGGIGASEDDQAVAQVQAFIESHGESRFTPIGKDASGEPVAPYELGQRTHNRAGWRRRAANGEGWEYLILTSIWKTDVCKGMDPKKVTAVMRQRQLLVGGTTRHPADLVKIPGEGSVRVYRVPGHIMGQADPEGGEEVE